MTVNILKILLVIVIVCAAIFVITYVAYEKGRDKEKEDCDSCNGDCLSCGRQKKG